MPVCMAAKILDEESFVCCTVRDLSTLGARLEFPTTDSLPDQFDLAFDAARTIRVCRVAWRTSTEVGVEFRGVSIGRVPSI